MEFSAQVAGAEIKSSSKQNTTQSSEPKSAPLTDRLRNKLNKDKEKEAIEKGSTKFSDGVGYKII